MSKTAQAIEELELHHPIQNRGHAYKVLISAKLIVAGKSPASARIYTAAVQQYEVNHGVVLAKSDSEQRKQQKLDDSREAWSMDAQAVLRHIERINEADGLFWACWALFKNGRWEGELSINDFKTHFRRPE